MNVTVALSCRRDAGGVRGSRAFPQQLLGDSAPAQHRGDSGLRDGTGQGWEQGSSAQMVPPRQSGSASLLPPATYSAAHTRFQGTTMLHRWSSDLCSRKGVDFGKEFCWRINKNPVAFGCKRAFYLIVQLKVVKQTMKNISSALNSRCYRSVVKYENFMWPSILTLGLSSRTTIHLRCILLIGYCLSLLYSLTRYLYSIPIPKFIAQVPSFLFNTFSIIVSFTLNSKDFV